MTIEIIISFFLTFSGPKLIICEFAMEFRTVFIIFLLTQRFASIHGMNYKIKALEACASSDEKVMKVEACSVTPPSIFNSTLNILQPLNDVHVSSTIS